MPRPTTSKPLTVATQPKKIRTEPELRAETVAARRLAKECFSRKPNRHWIRGADGRWSSVER